MGTAGGVDKAKTGEGLTKETKRLMVPAGCRAYMRRVLAAEFPGIVKGFVDAAKTGSCPHVKLATELMRPVRKSPRKKKGSVARFMERFEKDEGRSEK